jgi:Fic family protein
MQVRVSNNLIHWVRFFLNGVAQTATKGRDTFQQVLALRNQAEQQILQLGKRTPNARQALSVLYRKPMVTAADLERELGLSQPTVNALLRDFMKLGLLREVTGAVRNRLYVFESYLELFIR